MNKRKQNNTKENVAQPFVSIITPTYNRAHTLERLFESLKAQTDTDFEWIVIDDGSTDDTPKKIKEFMKEKPAFVIKHHRQENKGMHIAFNRGLDYVAGKMVFLLGSDDMLTLNAIEIIRKEELNISRLKNFAGLAFSLVDENGQIIGTRTKEPFIDTTTLELKKYNIKGDKCQVYYSNILTEYRFPEFDDEKFQEMAYVFYQIGKEGLRLRWFNKEIYVAEYSQDGMTKAGDARYKGSPKGMALYTSLLMTINTSFIQRCLLQSLYARQIYNYKNLKKATSELEGGNIIEMYIGVFIRKLFRK